MGILVAIIDLYTIVVFISVIASWFPVAPDNPIVAFINTAVEPVLAPLRRILPAMGGLDFTPIILLVGLRLLRNTLI